MGCSVNKETEVFNVQRTFTVPSSTDTLQISRGLLSILKFLSLVQEC